MPNIYLRLPTIIAIFYRNRDEDNVLSNSQPVVFSKYDKKSVIIENGLHISHGPVCSTGRMAMPIVYSQTEWNNLLRGSKPEGGKPVIKRDPKDWITYEELTRIEGRQLSSKSESYDYLCIKIPNEFYSDGKIYRTNNSYKLTKQSAMELQGNICLDFKRTLLDWELQNNAFCIKPNMVIRREHIHVLERFLMHYNIPFSYNTSEVNSLRRQLQRWLRDAISRYDGIIEFDLKYRDPKDKEVPVSPDGTRATKLNRM